MKTSMRIKMKKLEIEGQLFEAGEVVRLDNKTSYKKHGRGKIVFFTKSTVVVRPLNRHRQNEEVFHYEIKKLKSVRRLRSG
jgi:flagellar biosynthesis/type III secretory pathway ATPase